MDDLLDDVSEGTKVLWVYFAFTKCLLTVFIFQFCRNVPSYRQLGQQDEVKCNSIKVFKKGI